VLCARFARRLRSAQADGVAARKALDHPRTPQQFEVVKALVPWDVSGLGDRNGAREQEAAGVAVIADALGHAGEPRQQGRVEGVGQKDGAVEPLLAEAVVSTLIQRLRAMSERVGELGALNVREAPPRAQPFHRGAGDHAVDRILTRVQIRDPRPGDHRDVRVGKDSTNGANGGERHHRIAQPVGGAHIQPRHRRRVEFHCS
jgi:hypothetical protein